MVNYLQRSADLHMAQLMPLPLTVSCFSKIQTGFTLLLGDHLGSPGPRAVKRVCVWSHTSQKSSALKYTSKKLVSLTQRKRDGRLFHASGLADHKARSPNLVLV